MCDYPLLPRAMSQSGAFRNEKIRDGAQVNNVTQVLDEEKARLDERGHEVAARDAQNSDVAAENSEDTEMERREAVIDELDVM